MWKKASWVAEKLGVCRPTVRRWALQERFNKTLVNTAGQIEYWSETSDGSDLLKKEEMDLSISPKTSDSLQKAIELVQKGIEGSPVDLEQVKKLLEE